MMEGSQDFLAQLAEAIARRAAWIETGEIPRLSDALRSYHSLFESIVGMLVRKGLLREDPYNYDQAVTALAVPRDDPLPEVENTDELSYRLAAYRRQLEFLATGQRLTLGTLDMARLKTITSLVNYINWADFGERSSSPMTRAFARSFMKVRMGADPMAAGIIKDSQAQVEKSQAGVRAIIAGIVLFHRESWKLSVRSAILPRLPATATAKREDAAGREDALRAVRRLFTQQSPGKPFYPELVEEILAEDRGEDGGERRAKLLAGLAIAAEQPKPAAAVPLKPLLLEAARALCRCNAELSAALATLVENQRSLESRRRGIGGLLRRWILRGLGQKDEGSVYEVEYTDNPTAGPKSERISFPGFLADAKKKTAVLTSLAGPAGLSRLEAAAEPALLEFLDKLLSDLFLLHRRMAGLNAAFQSRAAEGRRTDIKGIRLELVAVKNSIVKANQRRHEYAARREEQEQLGRLAPGAQA